MTFRICFLFWLMPFLLSGQDPEAANVGNAWLLQVGYGFQVPGGDLGDRFGNSLSPSLGVDWMQAERNWFVGLDAAFFFGQTVKEDVLSPLRTTDGGIMGNDRQFADIQLRQRAYFAGLHMGKLFTLGSGNHRSGLRVALGGGLFAHKIRIQDDPSRQVPQLSPEYKKGYDRLSIGPALRQNVGYQLLSRDGRINLHLSLEFLQGFTRNQRALNFDTREQERTQRLDLQFGVRATWTLPFYSGKGQTIYY